MILLLSALIVAAAVAWAAVQTATELKRMREQAARGRLLQIFSTFAAASSAAGPDPRALLEWVPLARTARTLFPDEFAQLDRAAGEPFPFGAERIQSAHAAWTANWLEWERSHDADYKLKAAAIEEELERTGASPVLRARLDGIEREKLALYQRKYEEYVRVGKSLKALEV